MLSVSELNRQIKASLETTFEAIIVEGEIASVTYHSSGHLYFSIKDEDSTLKCVMWKSSVSRLKFKLEIGEHIVITGNIAVYIPRGEYQLIAKKIEPFGQGALSLAYEQLKTKLQEKGYFDKSIKKDIPLFIKKLAVVTAINSAAFEDILKVANKRWPLVEIIAIDTLVQGNNASNKIAKAIKYADKLKCDAILIARGGGSKEDLWAFNEEVVADAIFEASTPIISAIGHEVDVLISDFVADLRAPTPSAAIEMILPNRDDFLFLLEDFKYKFDKEIKLKIFSLEEKVKQFERELSILNPEKRIDSYIKEFKNLYNSLNILIKRKIEYFEKEISPLKRDLKQNYKYFLSKKSNDLKTIKEQLLLHNPSKKLKSGFVEVIKDKKRIDICKLKSNDEVELVSPTCKIKVVVK